MPTIHFLGQIFPNRKITVNENPQVELRYATFRAIVTIHIRDSRIDVVCELDQYEPKNFELLLVPVFQLARAWVDALAFSRGMGFTTVIESLVDPAGEKITIQCHDPSLEGLCQIQTGMVAHLLDLDVGTILHMLTSTLEEPHLVAVNCARAIEAIAHQISPDETDKKRRWKKLQDTLHATREYTERISTLSVGWRPDTTPWRCGIGGSSEGLDFDVPLSGIPQTGQSSATYLRVSIAAIGSSEAWIMQAHTPAASSPSASAHAFLTIKSDGSFGTQTYPASRMASAIADAIRNSWVSRYRQQDGECYQVFLGR